MTRTEGDRAQRSLSATVAVLTMAALFPLTLHSSAMAYPRPGRTELVSVASNGRDLSGQSFSPAVSDDGRFVAFVSSDVELASDSGILLRDRLSGHTERIAPSLGGALSPSMSGDGRFIAFESFHDVTHPDPPGGFSKLRDIFVFDRMTGEVEQASVSSEGGLPNSYSQRPAISANGRFVAFTSVATNLVPDDTNGLMDVFVKDLDTGRTERVSVSSDGVQGNQPSGNAWASIDISADGRYVAFTSDATNLVAQDLNLTEDIFVHDRSSGTTERVSIGSDGSEADGASQRPSISADGRFVAFDSWAVNLVPGDGDRCAYLPVGPLAGGTTCGDSDVFVHDRDSGSTERISVASDGQSAKRGPRGGNSWAPALTADGRYVAFYSSATNLVNDDTNEEGDVFVHDRLSGATDRVSVASDGTGGNASSDGVFGSTDPPAIGADGRYLAFRSTASNLDGRDTTDDQDIFVRDRGRTLGVNDIHIEQAGDELLVSGWATFAGSEVGAADDVEGDGGPGAGEAGADLIGASLTHRPELEDVLVRMRVTSFPSLLLSAKGRRVNGGVGAPAVHYGLSFEVGEVRYEVRAARDPSRLAEDAPPDPVFAPPSPHFALFRCDTTCVQTERLSGAIGTTGNEVRISLPVAALGTDPVIELRGLEATTSFRPGLTDPLPMDELALPDVSIETPRVGIGIAPRSATEQDVAYTAEADLEQGAFVAPVDASTLEPGNYSLWTRGCFARECGSRSVAFTISDDRLQTSLSVEVERVRGESIARAVLLDAAADPISGAEITFSIDNEVVGSAVTDDAGRAQMSFRADQFHGRDVLRVDFAGDDRLAPSSAEITARG